MLLKRLPVHSGLLVVWGESSYMGIFDCMGGVNAANTHVIQGLTVSEFIDR